MSERRDKTCDHCGRKRQVLARVSDVWLPGGLTKYFVLCHPNGADHPVHQPSGDNPDCYRLVTVYGETIGARRNV